MWLMHAKACKDKKQKESLLSPKGETIMKIKRILAVMLAGAMMLSMAACGGESKEESAAQPSAEQKTIDGNVLDAEQYFNGYIGSEPTTLDSVVGNDQYSGSVLTNTMEPLTRLAEKDGKNVREGAGAESWESNEDGTVWTFHLRDNNWSDGQPVKAQDYVYSIVRTLTPETGSPNSYLITCVKNANAVLAGEMDPSELGVKAIDDKTVEFTLEQPTPYFLSLTDTRVMMPQRQDIVEQYGESYGAEASNLVYNGPFKLESWMHNSELVLVKNDQYWDKDNVNLQTINYKIMNDENTIFNSFTNGSIDSCGCGTPEWMQKFEAMENVDYIHYTSPAVRFNFYNTKDELFQNANIRNAFTLALDREDIVNTIYFGTMSPAYSWVPDGVSTGEQGIYRAQVEEPLKAMYETADPKELLLKGMEELGLGSDPSTLEVTFSLGGVDQWMKNYGEYYQQTFKNVLGVNVVLDFNEWGTFQSKVNSGDYQMGYMSWGIDYNDPYSMLAVMYSSSNNINTGWVNEKYDELLDQAAVEMDDAKRLELYKEAETILFEEGPLCPVVNEAANTFRYNYIKNSNTMPFTSTGLKYAYVSGRNA